MTQIFKVAGIIIQGRKLLFARAKGKDRFIDPGGKVEEGETAEQALVRELKEELGIDVAEADLEFFGEYTANDGDKAINMKAYIVKTWQGKATPEAEIEELRWLTSNIPADIKVGSIFGGEVLPKLHELGMVD